MFEDGGITCRRAEEASVEIMKPSAVPAYLRDSEFGASLTYEDEEDFSIPIGVTKLTPEVNSLQELEHFLATIRFWGLRDHPAKLIEIAFTNDRARVVSTCKQYSKELPRVAVILEALVAPVKDQMNIAMGGGYLDLVKYLQGIGQQLTADSVRAAIDNEQVECLQHALQENRQLTSAACTAAVATNSAACCRIILNCWPPGGRELHVAEAPNYNLCDAAACIGDVQYIKSVQKSGGYTGYQASVVAAQNGQLDCLKYLRDNGLHWSSKVLTASVKGKHFDCVAYALQNMLQNSADAQVVDAIVEAGEMRCLVLLTISVHLAQRRRVRPCVLAAKHGHLDCLTFLYEQGYRWNAHATAAAASAGHYERLWYAIQQGCSVHKSVCSTLARDGGENLLMQFAQLNIPAHPERVAICAATNGYMDCLQHVVRQGCQRSADVCTAAADTGQLACLQYLRAEGFPWDSNTTQRAALHEHYECLEYALQQGCASDVRTFVALAGSGQARLLQLALGQQGCGGSASVRTRASSRMFGGMTHYMCISVATAAARNGQLPCLQFLHEELRFPVLKAVSAAAVRGGQWECVRYLARLGCRFAQKALRGLAERGYA